ncbi:hypothetical protein G8S49_06005 [Clostridium botulinum C]|uniref:Uncharacterized protein n=1 Tax=Clostridium botulinum C TaxID=36828 RepID=A0A9Q3YYV2_CLOBO|nr:hypothetical protein [Clostridium botulinum]MCD3194814.1 hypothetical protein [Clostridium botulinum C]MCD3200251.1 hypothetical protein [Clostridium botulinum C]MCD3205682.1 hypothetical protein [Clostridium botulinum C]MCD3207483.1 hypothetical protein [Clostridium botulinum C]MCD3226217.1 hypothetical protein [Clostridium botulinum C]
MIDVYRNANNLFSVINRIVVKLLAKVKFNYVEIGAIIAKNDDNTYKIRINDNITDVKSLHGIEYKTNDVVYILIMNQDFRQKLILDKVYG